ncbi:MAG: response regulator [Deltaproteobacteria bacterium]|jgi:DNA-binding NtrC family response regulator|nr:response regulator [Deltaproteobacteria bacterium]MBW2532032.1 response regulator [Deltaproteobacteria bacterium]
MTAVVRVLLVDDEPDFLTLTARRLQRRGLVVETATCAQEAMERLATGGIQVVVLDVQMPGLDGHRAFRTIRARFPSVECIILTGHGTVIDAFELSKSGLFDYLQKPCDIDQLNDKIRQACQYLLVRDGDDGPGELA